MIDGLKTEKKSSLHPQTPPSPVGGVSVSVWVNPSEGENWPPKLRVCPINHLKIDVISSFLLSDLVITHIGWYIVLGHSLGFGWRRGGGYCLDFWVPYSL